MIPIFLLIPIFLFAIMLLSFGSVAIENYRYEDAQLYKELIQSSLPRTVCPGWNEELDYLKDDILRYDQVVDSTNPQVTQGRAQKKQRYATFRTSKNSLDITKIEESIGYSNTQLSQIEGSELPFDEQVKRIIEKFGETEERLFFAGDPGISTTGTTYPLTNTTFASTTITTNLDLVQSTDPVGTIRQGVGKAVGQLLDTYKQRLKRYVLFAVWSLDCYKILQALANQYTDANILELLTKDLKMVGAETPLLNHSFMSPYLFGQTGALDYDGEDVVLEVTGTQAFALICMDSNSFFAKNSPFYQNPVPMPRGMDVDLGESVLYKYTNNDAIIYDNNVAIT